MSTTVLPFAMLAPSLCIYLPVVQLASIKKGGLHCNTVALESCEEYVNVVMETKLINNAIVNDRLAATSNFHVPNTLLTPACCNALSCFIISKILVPKNV